MRLERFVAHVETDHAICIGAHVESIDVALGEQRRNTVRERLGLKRLNAGAVGVDRGTRAEDGDGEHHGGDRRRGNAQRQIDRRAYRIHVSFDDLETEHAVEWNPRRRPELGAHPTLKRVPPPDMTP